MNKTTKDLTLNALLIALVFIATRYINISLPYGYFHAGDGFIYAIALTFGYKRGIVSGALGMGLADALSPYAMYTIPTIIIKALMVIVLVKLANKIKGDKISIIGMVIAGLVGTLGYFTFEYFYYGVEVATPMVVPNILQASVVATLLGSLLTPVFKRIESNM